MPRKFSRNLSAAKIKENKVAYWKAIQKRVELMFILPEKRLINAGDTHQPRIRRLTGTEIPVTTKEMKPLHSKRSRAFPAFWTCANCCVINFFSRSNLRAARGRVNLLTQNTACCYTSGAHQTPVHIYIAGRAWKNLLFERANVI